MPTPDTYIGGTNWTVNGINWTIDGSENSVNVEQEHFNAIPHRFPAIVSATLLAGAFIFPLLSPITDNRINQAQSTTRYIASQTPTISRTHTKQGKVWDVSGDGSLSLQSLVRALDSESVVEDTNDLEKKTGYDFQAWAYNGILEEEDGFEVIALTQEVRDLFTRINEIDDKYDKKITDIDNKLWKELKEISASISGIDKRLVTIETNVSKTEDRTKTWKLFILLPIITTALGGVVTTIIVKLMMP